MLANALCIISTWLENWIRVLDWSSGMGVILFFPPCTGIDILQVFDTNGVSLEFFSSLEDIVSSAFVLDSRSLFPYIFPPSPLKACTMAGIWKQFKVSEFRRFSHLNLIYRCIYTANTAILPRIQYGWHCLWLVVQIWYMVLRMQLTCLPKSSMVARIILMYLFYCSSFNQTTFAGNMMTVLFGFCVRYFLTFHLNGYPPIFIQVYNCWIAPYCTYIHLYLDHIGIWLFLKPANKV